MFVAAVVDVDRASSSDLDKTTRTKEQQQKQQHVSHHPTWDRKWMTNHDDEEDELKCTCLGMTDMNYQQNHTSIDAGAAIGARILYLITVHNQRTIDDAVYLLRSIRDVRNTILIHIDIKLNRQIYFHSQLYREVQNCPCGSRVIVESLFDCICFLDYHLRSQHT